MAKLISYNSIMKLQNRIKKMISNDSIALRALLWMHNHLPFNNKLSVFHNLLKIDKALLSRSKIIIKGKDNIITIGKGCRLYNCRIYIKGNNNIINLSDYVYAKNAEFYIENDNNKIICNEHIFFAGKIQLACTEGKSIEIGRDCLFSSEIVIRTGDSHSIIDMDGVRLNKAKNVVIGKHVWVGYRVLINKGVKIADNSMIGTGSIVTHEFVKPNVCIVGNPAKIIRENIDWMNEII